MVPEWEKFAIIEPSGPSVTFRKQGFTEVFHVAHVEAACKILSDGKIKIGTIRDESKLRDQNISVAWLSPNRWKDGFRYGGVCFGFEWANVLSDYRAYWVEAMAYGISACRILITHKQHPALEPYDPGTVRGPWKSEVHGGETRHYFNHDYCLEFMLEIEVDLSTMSSLTFVKHHPKMCCIHPRSPATCGELGWEPEQYERRLISFILGNQINLSPELIARSVVPAAHRLGAYLCEEAEKVNYSGKEISSVFQAEIIKILKHFALHGTDRGWRDLLGQFISQGHFEYELEAFLENKFR